MRAGQPVDLTLTTNGALLARKARVLAENGRKAPSLPPLLPLPAHGTVVLVSDWLDPLDGIEAMIRHYASAGVRGHIVQVLDPAEEDLPFDGHVKFEGLEAEGQHTIRRVETVGATRLTRAVVTDAFAEPFDNYAPGTMFGRAVEQLCADLPSEDSNGSRPPLHRYESVRGTPPGVQG